MEQNRVKALNV